MTSALLLAPLLLTACASDSHEAGERPARVIVGQGTSDDRAIIDAYNRQILQTEQGTVSTSPAASAAAQTPAAPTSQPSP